MVPLVFKITWQFLKGLNRKLPYGQQIYSNHIPQRNENVSIHTKLCTNVDSSDIHDNQNTGTTEVLSSDEQVRNMWHIHAMNYYIAMKNGVLLEHGLTYVK